MTRTATGWQISRTITSSATKPLGPELVAISRGAALIGICTRLQAHEQTAFLVAQSQPGPRFTTAVAKGNGSLRPLSGHNPQYNPSLRVAVVALLDQERLSTKTTSTILGGARAMRDSVLAGLIRCKYLEHPSTLVVSTSPRRSHPVSGRHTPRSIADQPFPMPAHLHQLPGRLRVVPWVAAISKLSCS